jgi:uncharacterized membrane protein YbjE (DUF340 family)
MSPVVVRSTAIGCSVKDSVEKELVDALVLIAFLIFVLGSVVQNSPCSKKKKRPASHVATCPHNSWGKEDITKKKFG